MKKIFGLILMCLPTLALAADYHIGPGQAYTTIGAVPWYSLAAGDTVYIHYRATPYREKFLISGRGTATQWIRVLGVPGPNGELPIISGDGATTSTNNHHHWLPASGNTIQNLGVVHIAVNNTNVKPAYIEIANLQIQDGYVNYQFTGEDGSTAPYDGFAACIYVRASEHVLIRNNILTNCGQGIFTWTNSGASENWWEAAQEDTVVRGNYFYNNGHTNSYTEHQIYMQSDGATIEFNRFGPQRSGAMGSQIKSRSAGDIIRYNYIEQSRNGWNIDLVEPEDADSTINSPRYGRDFVYGNLIVNRGEGTNMVHWNEDHQVGVGRATVPNSKLVFYNNTILITKNRTWDGDYVHLFNETYGSYDCPPSGVLPGRIDFRNNIVAMLPATSGGTPPELRFGYCGQEKVDLGVNWVSPNWSATNAVLTGTNNLVSPANNNPGFVNAATGDLHLVAGSSARGIGGALAPEVTSNLYSLDLTPYWQYHYHQRLIAQVKNGVGSDLGALGFETSGSPIGDPPSIPGNPPAPGGGGDGGNNTDVPKNRDYVIRAGSPAHFECEGSGDVVIRTMKGAKAAQFSFSGEFDFYGRNLANGTYSVQETCNGAKANNKLVIVK